jgi:outer membrane lipoprotein-sorting protein
MLNRRSTLSGILQAVAFLMLGASVASAQSASDVLARLDQAAPSFKGMTASIRSVSHLSTDGSEEIDAGAITAMRIVVHGKKNQPAEDRLELLIRFEGKNGRSIALRKQTVEIYYPGMNSIQEYDIRKYGDVAQKLLLLGFGTSGRELAANYEIKNAGRQTIDSQPATLLELTPKSPDVLKKLTKVELWISDKTNLPLQQKFHFPHEDYKVVSYTNLAVNPHLSSSALGLPKGANRQRMN